MNRQNSTGHPRRVLTLPSQFLDELLRHSVDYTRTPVQEHELFRSEGRPEDTKKLPPVQRSNKTDDHANVTKVLVSIARDESHPVIHVRVHEEQVHSRQLRQVHRIDAVKADDTRPGEEVLPATKLERILLTAIGGGVAARVPSLSRVLWSTVAVSAGSVFAMLEVLESGDE